VCSKPNESATSAALLEIERSLGSDQVATDHQTCERYGRDESETGARIPEAVIYPMQTADVVEVLRVANRRHVPVTPRGAGTGRVGGAVPVHGGLVLSMERMARIKAIERENMVAVVEPGVITAELHRQVEAQGLFYPPDPNSLATCQIGGNIAENAGGPRAFRYGVTRDYVLGLEVVTGEGTRLNVGKRTFKGVCGFDLTSLIVGSEGTLAVVTEATLKLIAKPEAVATILAFMPDARAVQRTVSAAVASGLTPRCIELLDEEALAVARESGVLSRLEGDAAAAKAMLLIELDGDLHALPAQIDRCGRALQQAGALRIISATDPNERERLWETRREMSRELRKRARHKIAEDVVVPLSRIAELIEICRAIAAENGLRSVCHGHAGDGNLHVNFLWDGEDQDAAAQRAVRRLFEAVVAMGGTLTGEHGIGVLKAPYLGLEQSDELIGLQKRIKALFDPYAILNPGKIFI
jgi:glycolate oxidase